MTGQGPFHPQQHHKGIQSTHSFCLGLTLGCGTTLFLLLFLLTSPLSPFIDLWASSPPPRYASQHGNGQVYPRSVWALSSRGRQLAALVRQVRRKAPEEIKERCIAIIEGRRGSLGQSFAQAGQDWLLFHNYFFHIPYGKGSYLDIGSNHPFKLSNTFFFDKCLGWRGVCIEPNPKYHPLYKQYNRTCSLIPNCLSDHEGMSTMNFKKGLKGSLGKEGEEVECQTLSRVVAETRMKHADLASIDIEGSEYRALRCFPFRAYGIATWLVETDKAGPALFRLFLRNGISHVGDVLCPLNALHSGRTRVGVKLDSIFRAVQPSFIYGPSHLPGGRHFQAGPVGPCRPWSQGDMACPDQVPVIEVEEVDTGNMTLRDGVCGLPPYLGANREFALPTSEHPNIYKA